jgi:cytochrome c-type biogenesis protein
MEISLAIGALLAGFLMVFAPCTLPVLPAYISFLTGVADCQKERLCAWRMVAHALLFVLGFSCTFILFGALASMLGGMFSGVREALTVLGGVAVIVFGLLMLRVVHMPMLRQYRQIAIPASFRRFGTPMFAVLFGAVFAIGWTPCVGPIVATVLLLVGSSDTFMSGLLPLVAFLVGFAVPFLAIAYGAERLVARIIDTRAFVWVERVSGVLLVVLGVLLLFGEYHTILGSISTLARTIGWEGVLLRWL